MAEPEAEARVLLAMADAVIPLVQELRMLVKEVLPEAEERAHPGWTNFNYYLSGELGYVGAQGNTAVLGLTRGVDLADPAGLLTSTKGARYMRQVRIDAGDPIAHDAIVDLLLQARRLNLERGPPEAEWRARGRKRA